MFKIACTCPIRNKEFFVTGVIESKDQAIEELSYWNDCQSEGGFKYKIYQLV